MKIGIFLLILSIGFVESLTGREYDQMEFTQRLLSGGGHGGHGHEATSKYNCPTNCLECHVKPPHKCTKCLANYFVDTSEKDLHHCKKCKVDRCNLCKEEKVCLNCRIGHRPKGNACVETLAFKTMAYSLLASSGFFGTLFFVLCIYFGIFVKDDHHGHHNDHHNDHDNHHKKELSENLNEHAHSDDKEHHH